MIISGLTEFTLKVVTRKHLFSHVLKLYNAKQEDFIYKTFLTDSLGALTRQEGFTRWYDMVFDLHERKDYKPVHSEQYKRQMFVKKFNESMVTE